MAETGPKTYLGAVGLETLKEWAVEEIQSRGGQVVTPVISYSEGTGLVSITSQTTGADIRYTLDKSEPTKGSTAYTAPFAVEGTVTIKAKAYKENLIGSRTAEMTLELGPKVIAVQWDYGNSSSALTRLTPETDPLGLVTETIDAEPVVGVSSPFDAYAPWNGMKRRNFASGAPEAWDGEDGFSTTTKDTMVWIPEFWVKVVDNAGSSIRDYYLSTGEAEGFVKHPGSGQYVGAYPTSNNNQSMSGKSFQVNRSIVTMRTNAKAKGAGWGLIDWAERSAIQFLFIIEFANWNSQGIFNQTAGTQNQTGLTDTLTYHTGYNGKVRYRWIEDIWNGVFEWTDGLNVVNGQVYVSTDRDNYQSDVTAGYTLISGCAGNNYNIQKLKYDAGHPWSIGLPEATGGSAYDQYIGDDGLISSGTYVLACGGDWRSNANYGLFRFYAYRSSSYSYSNYGSRLSYKAPQAS